MAQESNAIEISKLQMPQLEQLRGALEEVIVVVNYPIVSNSVICTKLIH